MKILSLLAVPAVVSALAASHATSGPAQAASPQASWQGLRDAHAAAAGVEIAGEGGLEFFDGVTTIEMDVRFEARLARPVHGSVELKQKGTTGESQVVLIGTGERVVLVDHGTRSHFPIAEEWIPILQPEPVLLAVWRGETVEPVSIEAVRSEDAGKGATGLRIELEDRHETVLLENGRPVEVAIALKDGSTRATYRFAEWRASAEVDLDAFRAAPPADYKDNDPLIELEMNLLPVGETIPDVTVRDLSGEQVALASLRGKTLLLNFWFYH